MSTRAEIDASIIRTQAVLARLTRAQFEQVNSIMLADLKQWRSDELALVHARRKVNAASEGH